MNKKKKHIEMIRNDDTTELLRIFVRPGEHAGITCRGGAGGERLRETVIVDRLDRNDCPFNAGLMEGDVLVRADGLLLSSHTEAVRLIQSRVDAARETGKAISLDLEVTRGDGGEKKQGSRTSLSYSSCSCRSSLVRCAVYFFCYTGSNTPSLCSRTIQIHTQYTMPTTSYVCTDEKNRRLDLDVDGDALSYTLRGTRGDYAASLSKVFEVGFCGFEEGTLRSNGTRIRIPVCTTGLNEGDMRIGFSAKGNAYDYKCTPALSRIPSSQEHRCSSSE